METIASTYQKKGAVTAQVIYEARPAWAGISGGDGDEGGFGGNGHNALTVEAAGAAAVGEGQPQPVDNACAPGAMAVAGEIRSAAGPQPKQHRYGYREDSPPEIIALLQLAQAGDAEAYGELYRLHVERVTRYVAARTWPNRTDVPDIVQETFCEAFAGLANAHYDVKGWLLAHAAKACLRQQWSNRRYWRAVKTAEEKEKQAGVPPEAGSGRAEAVPSALGRLAFVHALSRLTPLQRQAVQLRFLDGLPRDMRVRQMGRSLEAVKDLEWRALRRLRGELSG